MSYFCTCLVMSHRGKRKLTGKLQVCCEASDIIFFVISPGIKGRRYSFLNSFTYLLTDAWIFCSKEVQRPTVLCAIQNCNKQFFHTSVQSYNSRGWFILPFPCMQKKKCSWYNESISLGSKSSLIHLEPLVKLTFITFLEVSIIQNIIAVN